MLQTIYPQNDSPKTPLNANTPTPQTLTNPSSQSPSHNKLHIPYQPTASSAPTALLGNLSICTLTTPQTSLSNSTGNLIGGGGNPRLCASAAKDMNIGGQ